MFDDTGRHVGAITTRETEWDDEQQCWLLALQIWRAGQCRRCGGDLFETTDPLHDAGNPHGTHLYRRSSLKRCHRCTALMESEHQHSTPQPGMVAPAHPAAVQHHVELVPRGTPLPGSAARKPRQKPAAKG